MHAVIRPLPFGGTPPLLPPPIPPPWTAVYSGSMLKDHFAAFIFKQTALCRWRLLIFPTLAHVVIFPFECFDEIQLGV